MRILLAVALLATTGVTAQDATPINAGFESLAPNGAVEGWRPADGSPGSVVPTTLDPRSGVGAVEVRLDEPGRATVVSDPHFAA